MVTFCHSQTWWCRNTSQSQHVTVYTNLRKKITNINSYTKPHGKYFTRKRNLLAFRFHHKEEETDVRQHWLVSRPTLSYTHTRTQYIHSAADTPACHSSEQCVFGNLVQHNREIQFPIVFLREWSIEADHERWSDWQSLICPYWWTGHEERHWISIWLIWLGEWLGRFGVYWF